MIDENTLFANIADLYGDEQARAGLSPIEDLIEDARRGKPVILVDDERRENEGDLVVPAEKITPEIINFMITFCRGLVCMPMAPELVEKLGLPQMVEDNESRLGTAFTVTIGAKEGITTGISAFDRAHTIKVAVDPDSGPDDIVSPGHVFPLRANDGGVLKREGHTEAAVEIARLAGFAPAGVICEIIREDGKMARMEDLGKFASRHNLQIGTIASLKAYLNKEDDES